MNKYQEALNHLVAAQFLLEDLMHEDKDAHIPIKNNLNPEFLALSVLKKSHAPLSARDIGQNCRPVRNMDPCDRTEMLEEMIASGLIGSVRTSQTVKYFAIQGEK